MKRWITPRLVATILAAMLPAAQAGMGVTELPGLQGDGPVTVFHPTAAADRPEQRGPFTIRMATDAPPRRGNGRLVVVSHGSGGAPWVHTDLARALVDAGFVVAMPQHRGDHALDASRPGPPSWKLRPAEASRAIDAVAADARLAPLLSLDRVGLVGQSAGGHTALVHAGGRWSPARFKQHCEAHLAQDFPACVGTFVRLHGEPLDTLTRAVALGVIRLAFGEQELQSHHDPRVAVAVAGVPAAAHFDHASLASPRIPLGLVSAGRDTWLKPPFHGERVLAACLPRCTLLANLPQGGHNVMLSPLPPPQVLGNAERELLADPPGFDRGSLGEIDRAIVGFLSRHLLP